MTQLKQPYASEEWGPDVARRAGIDERLIARIVSAFYARVQSDALLGPAFAAKVHDGDEHTAILQNLWSGVLLNSGRYKGNLTQMHLPLAIDGAHFTRWLALLAEVCGTECSPEAAALFVACTEKNAERLNEGVAQVRANAPPHVLPAGAKEYKRTALFVPETLPAGLQKEHRTRVGVWGRIVVESGCVRYARSGGEGELLRAGSEGVIAPEEPHHVAFVEPGAFYVAFCRVESELVAGAGAEGDIAGPGLIPSPHGRL